jgi:hypothetical protein
MAVKQRWRPLTTLDILIANEAGLEHCPHHLSAHRNPLIRDLGARLQLACLVQFSSTPESVGDQPFPRPASARILGRPLHTPADGTNG